MSTQEALEALFQETKELIKNYDPSTPPVRSETRRLLFQRKEIKKMPKKLKEAFKQQEGSAYVKKTIFDDINNCLYEITYNQNGYDICVSDTELSEAKKKFIKVANEL